MNAIRGVVRRLRRPRPAEPEPHLAQLDFLRAARLELQGSYPRVRPWAILRLLRRHGLQRFPDGLLLEARPFDAFWMLLRVALGRHRSIDWHPLFSEPFYLISNPDLAEFRASPWLHYQVFGRVEGRTPHPLIDVARLAASMLGVSRGELVDEYFADPRRWLIDPSPYVDAQAFVVNGPWDGATHPLKQIVARHAGDPWLHGRLMIVDSSGGEPESRLIAAGALLTLAGGSARVATMVEWCPPAAQGSPGTGDYTVIPGYFLGIESTEVLSDVAGTLSPDSTMIRHSTGFVSVVRGQRIAADALVYLDGELPREELEGLMHRPAGTTVVAPSTASQEFALKTLRAELGVPGVTVLDHGVQAHITSASPVEILRPTREPWDIPLWDWEADVGHDVVVVLSHRHQRRASSDGRVRALIEAGAALCLVEGREIEPWLPLLNSRAHIVVERSLLGLMGGLVGLASLFMLPDSEVGSGHE